MFKKIYKYGEQEAFRVFRDEEMDRHELRDLFWECTLRCNLKCKHCGSFAGGNCYPDELTTEEIRNTLWQIDEKRTTRRIFLNVTGGEPLLREDLCDVMEYAVKDLSYGWGMTSNGMLFTQKNIEKLRKANLSTVSVSIDGLEKTHDSFRGVEGSYRTVVENIRALNRVGFLRHLQVTTVFHKDNINEIEALYDEIRGMGVRSWRLASVDPIGRAEQNRDILLSGEEIRRILDFIKKNNSKKLPLSYGCPGYLGIDYENEVRENYFFCRTGYHIASILYNGDIFVCPNVPRRKELIRGNVRKDDFWDIWNNHFDVFRGKERTACKECKRCDSWKYCLGGAFHTWDFDKGEQKKCPYLMLKK